MAFSHRVSAQQDVLKEAHSDILDRAGFFLSNGAGNFLLVVEKFHIKPQVTGLQPPPLTGDGDFTDAEIISIGRRLSRRQDCLHPGVPRDPAWPNQFLKLSGPVSF